jgi:putative SOS response-associated peptidase YedK
MCVGNTANHPSNQLVIDFDAPMPEHPTDEERDFERSHIVPIFYGGPWIAGGKFRPWPVVVMNGRRRLIAKQWSIRPPWMKPEVKLATYNARSEEMFDKPTFRESAAKRRCLVVSTGFVEWRHIGKVTFPYFIGLKSREAFAMAGLWDGDTFTICTVEANPIMKKIHNQRERMPVILPKESEAHWLDPALTQADVLSMCVQYPEDDMRWHTIGRDVTSRTIDPNHPGILEPVEYAGVVPL